MTGVPLSPLFYVITIEVLAANSWASRVIQGLALADDTLVVAFSDAAIHEVFHVYGRFELGTGSNLNLGKCEGLWLGSWRTRVDSWWTSNMIKVLGVFLGHGGTSAANLVHEPGGL